MADLSDGLWQFRIKLFHYANVHILSKMRVRDKQNAYIQTELGTLLTLQAPSIVSVNKIGIIVTHLENDIHQENNYLVLSVLLLVTCLSMSRGSMTYGVWPAHQFTFLSGSPFKTRPYLNTSYVLCYRFKIKNAPDWKWGTEEADGSWNGMVGVVHRGVRHAGTSWPSQCWK